MKTQFKPKAPMLALMAVVATISFSDFVTNKAFAQDTTILECTPDLIECNKDDTEITLPESSSQKSEETKVESSQQSDTTKEGAAPVVKTNFDDDSKPMFQISGVSQEGNEVQVPLKHKDSESDVCKGRFKQAGVCDMKISVQAKTQEQAAIKEEQKSQESKVTDSSSSDYVDRLEGTVINDHFTIEQLEGLLLNYHFKIKELREKISEQKLNEEDDQEIIQELMQTYEVQLTEINELKEKISELEEKAKEKKPAVLQIVKNDAEDVKKDLEKKIAELKKQLESKDEVIATHKAELEQAGEELELAWNTAQEYNDLACEYETKISGLEDKIEQLQQSTSQQLQMMQQMQMLSHGMQNPGFTFNPALGSQNNPFGMLQSFMMGQQMASLNNSLDTSLMLRMFSGLNNPSQNFHVAGNLYQQPMVYPQIPMMPQQVVPQQQMMQQQFMPQPIPGPMQGFSQGFNNGLRPLVNWN